MGDSEDSSVEEIEYVAVPVEHPTEGMIENARELGEAIKGGFLRVISFRDAKGVYHDAKDFLKQAVDPKLLKDPKKILGDAIDADSVREVAISTVRVVAVASAIPVPFPTGAMAGTCYVVYKVGEGSYDMVEKGARYAMEKGARYVILQLSPKVKKAAIPRQIEGGLAGLVKEY